MQANNWIAPIARGTTEFWHSHLPAAEFSQGFADTVDVWEKDGIVSSDEVSWMLLRASRQGVAGEAAVGAVTKAYGAVTAKSARVDAFIEQRQQSASPFITAGGLLGGGLCLAGMIAGALLGAFAIVFVPLVFAAVGLVLLGRWLGETVGLARYDALHPEQTKEAEQARSDLALARTAYKEALEVAARVSVAAGSATSHVSLAKPNGKSGVLRII